MGDRNTDAIGFLEFLFIIGIVIVVTLAAPLAVFFTVFVYIFLGGRWAVLNIFFRHKFYLPCYGGYYDYDVDYKLNWLKKHYRWRHVIEQDIIQIVEYPHYYGILESDSCIRGVTVRFAKKKHAVHFKMVCYNDT